MTPTKLINGLAIARLGAAVAVTALGATPALADSDIFDSSCTMLMRIKTFLFSAVYILGAIGLVLIAVSAFLGRFKFSHLISLGGGLFIVAMADALITWLTSEGNDAESCS